MYEHVEIVSVPKKLEYYLYNRIVYFLIKKGYKIKAFNYFFKILSNMKLSKYRIRFLRKTILFYKCVLNIRPTVYAVNVKKTRKTVVMPIVTRRIQQIKRSLFWIKQSDKSRKERRLVQRLENELVECYHGKGVAVKRKFEYHEIAVTQRPFLHILVLLR